MITQEQRWAAYLEAKTLGVVEGKQCGYEGSLVEKILRVSEEAAWMTIDTAPKDETVIEVWPICEDYPQVNRVFWKQNRTNPTKSAWHDLGDQYNAPGYFLGQKQITHWRYPSDPPMSQNDTGEG